MQPFFGRSGLNSVRHRKNKGSIRSDFEENEDEEEQRGTISPGPGHYQTSDNSFRRRERPISFQFFGSNVKRFEEKPVGTHLGPGQYKVSKPSG